MTFKLPTFIKSALDFLREKVLVPTGLSSRDLRQVEASVKRRSIFSARVTQVSVLQRLKDAVDRMLSGEANLAEGKLELQRSLDEQGYTAEAGFPADEPGRVPPAAPGSLTDLRSERRRRLQIDMNYRLAAGEAYWNANTTADAVFQFPAFELVRIEDRVTPRGYRRRKGTLEPDPGQDWPSRWLAAGGELWDNGTRMIALKSDPVWQALGDGVGGYDDTLGNPWSPHAFGTGYGMVQVDRQECLMLGLIDEEQELAAARESYRAGQLQVPAQGVDDETLAWFADLQKAEASGQVEVLKPSERLARARRSASDLVTPTANARARLAVLLNLMNGRAFA